MSERLEGLWRRRRPAIMGVVNVTPDSFSDGGRFVEPEDALAHAERLVAEGADLLDVGGESTRPGAEPVAAELERQRVVPVVAELRRRFPSLPLSIDTAKAAVAAEALLAGADVVNDVTAGRDPEMLPLLARAGATIVLMHMRGDPRTMQADTSYADVVGEVAAFLAAAAARARAAGIAAERIWLDPGIGFGKDVEGNLALLAALPRFSAGGHAVVVGASRKSFIGKLSGAGVGDRLPGSLAALVPAAGLERAIVRVHDVAATAQFLAVLGALRRVA